MLYHGIFHFSHVFSWPQLFDWQDNATQKWQVRYSNNAMVYHEKSGTVDAIENTVANVINATYLQHTIKRLGLTASVYNGFLIACIVNSLWLG